MTYGFWTGLAIGWLLCLLMIVDEEDNEDEL